MSDLSIIYVKTCAKNVYFQKEINGHTVVFDNRRGWSCDCDGYKFRRTCKHIKQAYVEKCSWNSELEEDSDVKDTCPKCGGGLEVVRVGV